VVHKRVVLLGIQDLQKRAGRIALVADAQLVNLYPDQMMSPMGMTDDTHRQS